MYMPVLIKISLVTNPELFTLTLMLRAGLDLMILMQNVYLSTLGENLLTNNNSTLVYPIKWNMDEIFDLKFHLS